MDEFAEIELANIVWLDPIRDEISEKDIEDMARSIHATGLIEPIVVERKDQGFNGIIGRLRYEGAKRAGITRIPARIHSFYEPSHKKTWQLIENLVRRELNPLQIGEGYRKLREYYKKEVGEHEEPIIESMQHEIQDFSTEKAPSPKTIWKYIQFAEEIPNDVKAVLRSLPRETFGKRHAEQLLRLKEDPERMLQMAEFIRDEKPTSARLKTEIDRILKVRERATELVKAAVAASEISLHHASEIADAEKEMQEPILELTKKGALKPSSTKKVVDFVEAHPTEAETILHKSPEQAVAIAEGKEVLETKGEVASFFRGKKGLAKQETFDILCTCPKCKSSFKKPVTVDWEKGICGFL